MFLGSFVAYRQKVHKTLTFIFSFSSSAFLATSLWSRPWQMGATLLMWFDLYRILFTSFELQLSCYMSLWYFTTYMNMLDLNPWITISDSILCRNSFWCTHAATMAILHWNVFGSVHIIYFWHWWADVQNFSRVLQLPQTKPYTWFCKTSWTIHIDLPGK